MEKTKDIILLRRNFSVVLHHFRNVVFRLNCCQRYPSDKELALILGISNVAFSSLSRGVTSPSGLVIWRLYKYAMDNCSSEDFNLLLTSLYAINE